MKTGCPGQNDRRRLPHLTILNKEGMLGFLCQKFIDWEDVISELHLESFCGVGEHSFLSSGHHSHQVLQLQKIDIPLLALVLGTLTKYPGQQPLNVS